MPHQFFAHACRQMPGRWHELCRREDTLTLDSSRFRSQIRQAQRKAEQAARREQQRIQRDLDRQFRQLERNIKSTISRESRSALEKEVRRMYPGKRYRIRKNARGDWEAEIYDV